MLVVEFHFYDVSMLCEPIYLTVRHYSTILLSSASKWNTARDW